MWGLKTLRTSKSKSTEPKFVDRRGERGDRRSFGPPTRFPFLDNVGKLVKVDRRSMPDRRLANIQVKEDHLDFDKDRFSHK